MASLRIIIVCLALWVRHCGAEPIFDVRANYSKSDVTIPVRDGVKLYTVIFTPRDTSRACPILLMRTPYSVPYGPDAFPGSIGPSSRFAEGGYIVVYQDVRGRYMSEGNYVNVRPQLGPGHGDHEIDESTDTYDTIEWLVRNVPNNNGRVGMWGISYPGFYAAIGAIEAHPALKAVSAQAPIADWFLGDDDHHNGAFFLMDNFDWDFSSRFDWPRAGPSRSEAPTGLHYNSSDSYAFYLGLGALTHVNERYLHGGVPFWNELMEHGTYDTYWKDRNVLPHLRAIHPAVLTVAGWYDAEDFYGPIHIYRAIRSASPVTENYLVVGPWPHGGWAGGDGDSFGGISFGSATAATFRDDVELPFFNHYLKGSGPWKEPRAKLFATGSNQWLSFDVWPPHGLTMSSYYFASGHRLVGSPSKSRNVLNGEAADRYVSDPTRPVPYIRSAGNGIGRDSTYMIADQRFAGRRSDVLVYQTTPLTDDVTIAGPITADLYVATTGTDSDWVVKVIDVLPDRSSGSSRKANTEESDGYEMLVRADVMRGKFRNSFEKPEPFVPGQVTRVKFALPDVCHTFKVGHKLMVQVQSSWFPLVDRNPQVFCDIYHARDEDFHPATNQLFHTTEYPSRIEFGSLGAAALLSAQRDPR